MTYYTADYLYNEFKGLAGMRKGNPAYTNDHTYWDDGECNWGGRHVLRTDCGVMARGFAKLESLDGQQITDTLTKTTSKGEFDSKKATLLQKIDEITRELQVRTGASSSMFGVCCIWGQEGMNYHVEEKLKEGRQMLERLRQRLSGESYQWVEDLKRIELEIRQIKAKMEENKRKALKETDPIKKQAIIAEIEADGKLLEQKYREHQQHSNKFNFNASRYVSDLVEKMKKAIENNFKKPRGGSEDDSSGGSGGNRGGSNSDDLFGGLGSGGADNNNPRIPREKRLGQSGENKDNSQMMLIAIAVIVILFLMTNQPQPQQEAELEYYY